MNKYAVYKLKTGMIYQIVESQPEHMVVNVWQDGFIQVEEDVDGDVFYVVDDQIVQRPAAEFALDGHFLKGVPSGSTVLIEGQAYTADGTDIELGFDAPGEYHIRVLSFPFLPWEGVYVEN